MAEKSIDERVEERRQAEEALRNQLAGLNLDGPHRLPSGGLDFGSMFGASRDKYAICLTCGAVVMLNDPLEADGHFIERSVKIHVEWHQGES